MPSMTTAPKDRAIEVLRNDGIWYHVFWHDCQWMRNEGEDIKDAWMIEGGGGPGYVELDEAVEWAKLGTHLMETSK